MSKVEGNTDHAVHFQVEMHRSELARVWSSGEAWPEGTLILLVNFCLLTKD